MSTTRRRRRRTPAELAGEAVQRAQARADDWGSNGPPRRPRLGHTADCPNNGRPLPRKGPCRFCRAEALGRREPHSTWRPARPGDTPGQLVPGEGDTPWPHQPPTVQERACSRCYRPTTQPDLCERCQPGGTP